MTPPPTDSNTPYRVDQRPTSLEDLVEPARPPRDLAKPIAIVVAILATFALAYVGGISAASRPEKLPQRQADPHRAAGGGGALPSETPQPAVTEGPLDVHGR